MRVEKIGKATLYLGDCRAVTFNVLTEFETVITDPPYGMSFQSNFRKDKHAAIENDDSIELLRWAVGLNALYSKYVFCRWDNIPDVTKTEKPNHLGQEQLVHGRP